METGDSNPRVGVEHGPKYRLHIRTFIHRMALWTPGIPTVFMTKTSNLDVAPAPWLELANLILFSDKHIYQLSSFFLVISSEWCLNLGHCKQTTTSLFWKGQTLRSFVLTIQFFESLPRSRIYRRVSPRMLQLSLASLSGLLIPHFKAGDFKDCCS